VFAMGGVGGCSVSVGDGRREAKEEDVEDKRWLVILQCGQEQLQSRRS
jgi:hypothetical protein